MQPNEKKIGFEVEGGYFCRIIPGYREQDYEDCIEDLFYETEVWLWTTKKGMHLPPKEEPSEEELVKYDGSEITAEISEAVKQVFGIGESLPSWMLARLWQLAGDDILLAMGNVNDRGEGFGDGGDFYLYLLVEENEKAAGVLEVRGDQSLNFININLTKRSEKMKADKMEVFYRYLGRRLLSNPQQLAVCSIFVKDPEFSCYPWTYGWDGEKLLRYSENRILKWYLKKDMSYLHDLVYQALNSIEVHPIGHLERGLREAICRARETFIMTHCVKAGCLIRIVDRMKLIESSLHKVTGLWNKTWPEDDTMINYQKKFYALRWSKSQEERQQLLEGWKEDWKYVNEWAEKTWIKNTKHEIIRFSAAFTGLAAVCGFKEAEREISMFDTAASEEIENETNIKKASAKTELEHVDTLDQFSQEDVFFYTACAFAGGPPYKMDGFEIGSKEQYKAFWRWWLLDCLPHSIPPVIIDFTL